MAKYICKSAGCCWVGSCLAYLHIYGQCQAKILFEMANAQYINPISIEEAHFHCHKWKSVGRRWRDEKITTDADDWRAFPVKIHLWLAHFFDSGPEVLGHISLLHIQFSWRMHFELYSCSCWLGNGNSTRIRCCLRFQYFVYVLFAHPADNHSFPKLICLKRQVGGSSAHLREFSSHFHNFHSCAKYA